MPPCHFNHLVLFLIPMSQPYLEGQRTIIVVEDEQDAAEMFAEMLRLNGFKVLKAGGCKAALELIAAKKPEAILLDIMLPDVSGLELLQVLRGRPDLAGIPVIVVSAKGLPSDIKTGLEAGASIYLTKPVGYLDLKEAFEKVIGA